MLFPFNSKKNWLPTRQAPDLDKVEAPASWKEGKSKKSQGFQECRSLPI